MISVDELYDDGLVAIAYITPFLLRKGREHKKPFFVFTREMARELLTVEMSPKRTPYVKLKYDQPKTFKIILSAFMKIANARRFRI